MDKKDEHQKLKICFVSLNSYPLLLEKNLGYVGGAEVQQVELAKELKRRCYNISFITYGETLKDVEQIDGIEVWPAYNRSDVNKLSSLSKALCIWRKMKEVNADIYFHRAGCPGMTSTFGIFHKKKTINSISSNIELTSNFNFKKDNIRQILGKIGNWLDIKLSDIVVSQSLFQKSKLKNRYKVDSILIKNAFKIPSQADIVQLDDFVLWVGTIRKVKQPSLFLKIAEHFPEHKFLMIGGVGESLELFEEIKNASNKIQNLKFEGFVTRDKIFDYYKKAIFLVNTSKTEGFPNVFLEAWLCFLPVISLNVDPDDIISKYKLGCHSVTFNRMINDIRNLLKSKELLVEMGKNGRKYVETYHNIRIIADRYENLFKHITK